jgi:hypothetical protein
MPWSDAEQEQVVAKRQERMQAGLDASADLPLDPPDKLLAASNALALKTQDELTEPTTRAAERAAEQRRRWVEEWKQEHENLRLHQHRKLGRVASGGLNEMEKRLAHGEPMVNEKGEVIGYRPIRTRDLDNIISTAIDKQIALEKRILGENEDGVKTGIPKPVTDLLERLELLAQQNPINGKVQGEYRNPVIDVTPEAND